jgi:hypothetical protein
LVNFEPLASLFLPAGADQTGVILRADENWGFDPSSLASADAAVWGRAPLPSAASLPAAVASAVRRVRALRSMRSVIPDGWIVAGVHGLPPPDPRPRPGRSSVRDFVLGGALVELARERIPRRVIDAAGDAAGAAHRISQFRAGSGGSALARSRKVDGSDFMLRVSPAGGPADPARAAGALERLSAAGIGVVPRLVGRGCASGASWSAESILPGRRPGRLTTHLALEVSRFCASLPREERRPPTALTDDLRTIGAAFPHWGPVVSRVGEGLERTISTLPAVMRHGDLWAGNLLADRGSLTGVIDWDAWHPAAVPGTDLLHLLARKERWRGSGGLGESWLRRPWRSETFHGATTDYWKALGIRPHRETLIAVGVAWWAGQVAVNVTRLPHLSRNESWVSTNVDAVIEALMR